MQLSINTQRICSNHCYSNHGTFCWLCCSISLNLLKVQWSGRAGLTLPSNSVLLFCVCDSFRGFTTGDILSIYLWKMFFLKGKLLLRGEGRMGSGGFSYPFQDHQHLQTEPVKKQGDHRPQITVARFMWAHKDASIQRLWAHQLTWKIPIWMPNHHSVISVS